MHALMVLFMHRSEVVFMHHMKVTLNGFFVIENLAAFWAHVLACFCFSVTSPLVCLAQIFSPLNMKKGKNYQKTCKVNHVFG